MELQKRVMEQYKIGIMNKESKKMEYITKIHSIAILMMAAVIIACSGGSDTIEDVKPVTPDTPKTLNKYTFTVYASKSAGKSNTRALSLDGNTLSSSWGTSEHIYVKKGSTWATGSLQPQSNETTAQLSGTLSDITINAGDDLTLQFPRQNIDYTGQVGTIEDIAAKYDYATATARVTSVNDGNISANPVTFDNQQAIVKFVLQNSEGMPISASSLTISDEGTNLVQSITADGTVTKGDITIIPASPTSEIFAALSDLSNSKVTLTAIVGSDTYTYEKTGVTFENSQYYVITVKMIKRPAFLSATSDDIGKVIGADGNLYNTKSDATAANTTASAVIAYVGSVGSVETGSNFKGLAIALYDCSNSNCTWQKDRSSKTSVYWCSQNNTTCTSIQAENITNALLYKNGISMTSELTSHATHSHYAAIAASTYNVTRPDIGTSGWFLPSVGQWELIVQGLTGKSTPLTSSRNSEYYATPVSAKIIAAGGSALSYENQYGYWSSIELSERFSSYMNFYTGYTNQYAKQPANDAGGYVRSVFAF